MKAKLHQILGSYNDLKELEKKVSCVKVKYDCAKIMNGIKPEMEFYDRERIAILESLAIETEVNGEKTKFVVIDGKVMDGHYNVDDVDEYQNRIAELLDIDIEIPWSINKERLLAIEDNVANVSLANIFCFVE